MKVSPLLDGQVPLGACRNQGSGAQRIRTAYYPAATQYKTTMVCRVDRCQASKEISEKFDPISSVLENDTEDLEFCNNAALVYGWRSFLPTCYVPSVLGIRSEFNEPKE